MLYKKNKKLIKLIKKNLKNKKPRITTSNNTRKIYILIYSYLHYGFKCNSIRNNKNNNSGFNNSNISHISDEGD